MKTVVVVQGAAGPDDVPGIDAIACEAELRFADTPEALRDALPGAEVLFGWNFRSTVLTDAWEAANRLRWIQWSGAGVDTALFPGLIASDVVLTNVRGLFDAAMAEYVLGLVLAMAKNFPWLLRNQQAARWEYRMNERIAGKTALVIGVGSIGRAIARMLRTAGMRVAGVGRRARNDDPDFDSIRAIGDLDTLLGDADYVILIVPLTADTNRFFGAAQLRSMKPTARLINLGRGALVDEEALTTALQEGIIAGAALDVFQTEPLPTEHPLWQMDNVIVSPHVSGDYVGYEKDTTDLFIENFHRFRSGRPLLNVVDKTAGFVIDPA